MKIESSVFEEGGKIPQKYTCEGDRFLSPPLTFSNIPPDAKSLALIVEDPDVPKEIREDGLFVHWVEFNIPPSMTNLKEGEHVGTLGANTRGEAQYTGPCPPTEYEPSTHRYIFTLYALEEMIDLPEGSSKERFLKEIEGLKLTTATLTGIYKKKD